MQDTLFTLIFREIDDRKKALQESLANGGARNYEDYCRNVGEHSALQRMEDYVKDLEKRFIAD